MVTLALVVSSFFQKEVVSTDRHGLVRKFLIREESCRTYA